MVSVMESKPSSLSPQASFVSCLSCHYCDCVSFDETDVNTYTAHLREAHSITRNVESLVALTLKEQQSRPEVVTPPAPTAVVQQPNPSPNVVQVSALIHRAKLAWVPWVQLYP